jgi:predicted RNA methylase
MSDEAYFASYSKPRVHKLMLADTERMSAYSQAILNNPHLFKDKVVLDVGCGTGILSLMAAQAGAQKVYAIDNCDITSTAEEIIAANNFDKVITVINGLMEDVILPEKVDVIVSEWMGYLLLFEGMLPTVLAARDRWLLPGGLMFPDKAAISIFGMHQPLFERNALFWKNVHGFDFSAMAKKEADIGLIVTTDPRNIITSPWTHDRPASEVANQSFF